METESVEKDVIESSEEVDSLKVYEVGYLLAPIIPEEKLAEEVGSIRQSIEKAGGTILSEEFPKLKPLAYSMTKVIGGRKMKFTTAYFGWIKFDVNTDGLKKIKEEITAMANVVRHLLIKTVRESTLASARPVFQKKISEQETEKAPAEGAEKKESEVKPKVSEAEIDKSIEDLITTIEE